MAVLKAILPAGSRVPQGTCGLKYEEAGKIPGSKMSGPARDLWIEILLYEPDDELRQVGSRKGPVD